MHSAGGPLVNKLCLISSALSFLPPSSLALLILLPLSASLSWACTLLLTGKLESVSADFNTETFLKLYEMNLKEQNHIKSKALSWRPELFPGLPHQHAQSHFTSLNQPLHLLTGWLDQIAVASLKNSMVLVLEEFQALMESEETGRQEACFGLIKSSPRDDYAFPAHPHPLICKSAFRCMVTNTEKKKFPR